MQDQMAHDQRLLGRMIRFCLTAIVAVAFALYVPLVLRAFSNTRGSQAALLVYSIPQVLNAAVLVGFPLGVFVVLLALSVVTRRPVPQRILGGAFCASLAGYYLLSRVAWEAGLSGKLPALAAAWFANAVFAGVAACVVKVQHRAS